MTEPLYVGDAGSPPGCTRRLRGTASGVDPGRCSGHLRAHRDCRFGRRRVYDRRRSGHRSRSIETLSPPLRRDGAGTVSIGLSAGQLAVRARTIAGVPTTVPVDVLVPEAVAGTGRRAARLGDHGDRTGRRVRGLEGALVDHSGMRLTALGADDRRECDIRVAGLVLHNS